MGPVAPQNTRARRRVAARNGLSGSLICAKAFAETGRSVTRPTMATVVVRVNGHAEQGAGAPCADRGCMENSLGTPAVCVRT